MRTDTGTSKGPTSPGPRVPRDQAPGPRVLPRGMLPPPRRLRGRDQPPRHPQDEAIEHDLDELLSQRDEYLDLAKRTKADFENYRKRMAAEVQAATVRGKAELASGLIEVIDTLERAIEAAGIDPAGDKAPDEGLAQGILLTYRQLCETLAQAGVESYDPAGERFDPAWHEALQKVQVEGAETGTVVEVMQKGYRLDGRVAARGRVVVSE